MYKKLHGDMIPEQKNHIIILRRWMWCGSNVCLGTRQHFEKRQDGWYCLACGRKYHTNQEVENGI